LVVTATVVAHRVGADKSGVPQPRYLVGERADVPESVYSATDLTVIFFAMSTCGPCQQSKNPISTLAQEFHNDSRVKLVMIGDSDSPPSEDAFAAEIGVPDAFV
jgi:hypothetical protein